MPGAPAPPSGPYRLDREPSFDVGIGIDLDSVEVAPLRRLSLSAGAAPGAGAVVVPGPVTARSGIGGFRVAWVAGGARAERTYTASDTVWLADADAASGAHGLRWQGKTWRGTLKLFLSPRGRLTLAARVPLETYLVGVVPGEIGGLAPDLLEAGRAQAIAARSYTLFYRGRRAAEGFDVYGTVEDQVYGPIESERPLATRCVQSTRAVAALWREQPIRANYSSTCGGISAEVWEAWPAEALGYLTSRRDASGGRDHCAASPHHRWREEWTAEEFVRNLATYGRTEGVPLPAAGVGELVDVRVAARSRSGRAWRLEARTTTGTILVPAHALRRVLRRGGNERQILRSNLIKIDVRRDPATRRALAVVASGGGSGHGVGLCQTGAIGMARAGDSAESILLHYYQDVTLRRLYE